MTTQFKKLHDKDFRISIIMTFGKMHWLKTDFRLFEELRRLICLKFKKKEESAFTPEWRKIGAAEADIYFKALQSSWE